METPAPLPTVIWFPSLAASSEPARDPAPLERVGRNPPGRRGKTSSPAEDRARLLRLIG
jgi:hypothetical protein